MKVICEKETKKGVPEIIAHKNSLTMAKYKYLKKDNRGYVKVYLSEIWNDIPDYVTKENNNICVELVESQNDGEVYKLIF